MRNENKLESIEQLSNDEQAIIALTYVAGDVMTQSLFLDILKNCGITITAAKFRTYRQELENKKWLELDFNNRLSLKEELSFEVLLWVKEQNYFEKLKNLVENNTSDSFYRYASFEIVLRGLRLALIEEEVQKHSSLLYLMKTKFKFEWDKYNFWEKAFIPINANVFDRFSEEFQKEICSNIYLKRIFKSQSLDKSLIDFMKKSSSLKKTTIKQYLFEYYIFQGKIKESEQLISNEKEDEQPFAQKAWIEFLKGNYPKSCAEFDIGLKLVRKIARTKKTYFVSHIGVLHILTMLNNKGEDYHNEILKYVAYAKKISSAAAFHYLQAVVFYQQGKKVAISELMEQEAQSCIDVLVWAHVAYWIEYNIETEDLKILESWHSRAARNGYEWIQLELAAALAQLSRKKTSQSRYAKETQQLEQKLKIKNSIGIVPIVEKWEQSLSALLQLKNTKQSAKKAKNESNNRLIWLVDFNSKFLQPKEQVITKSGKWSKGRNVALKRLKEGGVVGMTSQDLKVGQAVEAYSYGYYGHEDYMIDFDQAVKALVGHPLLFLNSSPDIYVELKERTPELIVEKKGKNYEIKFSDNFDQAGANVHKETPTRYTLLNVTEEIMMMKRTLGGKVLKVPDKAEKKLKEVIGVLSGMVTVHSTLSGATKDIRKVKTNNTIYMHLLPYGDGFKMESFVKPFKSDPPYFKPGVGREVVITEVKGKKRQVKRDLKAEKENLQIILDACPGFEMNSSVSGEWIFDETEDCLNILLEIEPMRQSEILVLEHPKGEKLQVVGKMDFSNLSMQIKKSRDWFSVEGKLKVDQSKVIDFKDLLEMVEKSTTRFIEISDGTFVLMKDKLRKQLLGINNMFSKTKTGLNLHPLAIPAIEEFVDLLDDIKVDAAWKKQLGRLKEAREIQAVVPSTFKAELRDYQELGFHWLTQLAHWGVGACLADDMGLGKTIQALAVLLDRATNGPAMVVAPASVARNWLREIQKFAPTLNPLLFGPGDRKKMIKGLKPFDILICTYGLMPMEETLLSGVSFSTIVLDEAQAIKNRSTKRSKTAMQLKGDFKILTTGTPVENHLGEIWNLFNFINPGLLGTLNSFNETFAVPIEKHKDKEKQKQLRHLLKPFILRRRKNDVLDELPEKTEITLSVEFSDEEKTMYEALRQNAIENIENKKEGARDHRFQILAELMRLRQACCHPQLVLPGTKIKSSKLELLGGLLEELIANGHKVLIFSQFVKHLRLVEQWVKSKGITYQYLDGQTPLPTREKSIDAFQAGEGDVFLISLKAGGTGLNLTAADYVIHLDPWWNPAVEDQASDRAHRIGQERPVTIYRLVVQDSVEEKIVQLHAEKRNLADQLLEGTEASAKLSADELLKLIKNG